MVTIQQTFNNISIVSPSVWDGDVSTSSNPPGISLLYILPLFYSIVQLPNFIEHIKSNLFIGLLVNILNTIICVTTSAAVLSSLAASNTFYYVPVRW